MFGKKKQRKLHFSLVRLSFSGLNSYIPIKIVRQSIHIPRLDIGTNYTNIVSENLRKYGTIQRNPSCVYQTRTAKVHLVALVSHDM